MAWSRFSLSLGERAGVRGNSAVAFYSSADSVVVSECTPTGPRFLLAILGIPPIMDLLNYG